MANVLPEHRVGTTLRGKYHLDGLLGVGGMAAVYEATHRNGHRVAVKILHPWANADEAVVKRFVREGYIANAIDHPAAVRVLDDDVAEDGSTFLVMDLLRGAALADLVPQDGALPIDVVVEVIGQLLDVLSSAHAKQIVHRDLKPDNLFVTSDGQVKLLDLGIARMRGFTGKTQPTRSGLVMGTPGFMAPEQVLGQQENIDPRTDLWAVAATMHFLLTGKLVHEAETAEQTMLRVATTPVPPIATIAREVPPAVASVVDRGLAMQREARWADAASMRAALDASQRALRLPRDEARDSLVRMVARPRGSRNGADATTMGPIARSVTASGGAAKKRGAALFLAGAILAGGGVLAWRASRSARSTTSLSATATATQTQTVVTATPSAEPSLPAAPPSAAVASPIGQPVVAASASPPASPPPKKVTGRKVRAPSVRPSQATPSSPEPATPAGDPFDQP